MYIIADVPKELLNKLEICIQEKGLDKYNKELAGNIKREYGIPKGKSIISPFLMQMILAYNEKYPKFWKVKHSMMKYKPVDVELQSLWVNFQKKYEFNPLHTHSGFVSFVIFMSIPYDLQDEEDMFKESNNKQASKFGFFSPDHRHLGGIDVVSLNVDKSYVGKMIMFKASQVHGVYPFYTSNDYRITVSGNLVFKVTN